MAETPDPQSAPRRTPRLLRITLFASLALNLLVVGLIAGAVLRGAPDRDGDRRPLLRDLGLGPFVEALPVRDRVALGRGLAREAGTLRESRDAVRRQFEAFLTLVRAETFDAAAATTLISDQQARLMQIRGLGRDVLIARLAEMDQDERRAYADRLSKLLRRPPPHGRPPRD